MNRPERYDQKPLADDPWEALALAVIRQAAMEYRALYRRKKAGTLGDEMNRMLLDAEQFFRGAWFKCLSDADGEIILQKLRGEDA